MLRNMCLYQLSYDSYLSISISSMSRLNAHNYFNAFSLSISTDTLLAVTSNTFLDSIYCTFCSLCYISFETPKTGGGVKSIFTLCI